MELAEVIKQIESGGNKRALRFEPAFFERLKEQNFNDYAIQKIKKLHLCNSNTALMIASTSWGLYQIMGYNLYFYHLIESNVFTFLEDEEKQKEVFYNFIAKKEINYSLDEMLNNKDKLIRFARRYNGSVTYANKILEVANDTF